jgi:hypothetical protein
MSMSTAKVAMANSALPIDHGQAGEELRGLVDEAELGGHLAELARALDRAGGVERRGAQRLELGRQLGDAPVADEADEAEAGDEHDDDGGPRRQPPPQPRDRGVGDGGGHGGDGQPPQHRLGGSGHAQPEQADGHQQHGAAEGPAADPQGHGPIG